MLYACVAWHWQVELAPHLPNWLVQTCRERKLTMIYYPRCPSVIDHSHSLVPEQGKLPKKKIIADENLIIEMEKSRLENRLNHGWLVWKMTGITIRKYTVVRWVRGWRCLLPYRRLNQVHVEPCRKKTSSNTLRRDPVHPFPSSHPNKSVEGPLVENI